MSRIGYNRQIHGSRPQPCPDPLCVPQPSRLPTTFLPRPHPGSAPLPQPLHHRMGRLWRGEAGRCPSACCPHVLRSPSPAGENSISEKVFKSRFSRGRSSCLRASAVAGSPLPTQRGGAGGHCGGALPPDAWPWRPTHVSPLPCPPPSMSTPFHGHQPPGHPPPPSGAAEGEPHGAVVARPLPGCSQRQVLVRECTAGSRGSDRQVPEVRVGGCVLPVPNLAGEAAGVLRGGLRPCGPSPRSCCPGSGDVVGVEGAGLGGGLLGGINRPVSGGDRHRGGAVGCPLVPRGHCGPLEVSAQRVGTGAQSGREVCASDGGAARGPRLGRGRTGFEPGARARGGRCWRGWVPRWGPGASGACV